MISPHTIQRIIDTARVDEVLSDFITLKKQGANYIANCPFHHEKTPSFVVSPAKGIYKCFGCSAAGNSVKFLMEHEKLNYPDALRYLAKKYQIEVEEIAVKQEAKELVDLRESLFIALQYANENFQHNLWENEEGKAIGMSYFKERGFSDDIIKLFQLGYCLDQWSAFSDEAIKKGYQADILVKAGLSKPNDNNGLRDFYKGRVMFPIHNLTGKVIGFGGRILKKNEKAPKYINTPESEVYHKSRILYGLYQSRHGIRREGYCLLVEGYTDVISLFQGGIDNVVASSGTSLTEDQIRQIKKFSEDIIILYDGDAAGIKAALRGLDMVLEQGLNIKLVLLPEGEDPDSYIRTFGAAQLKEYIHHQASDFILFKIKLLQEEAKSDPTKKTAMIQDIIASIARIADPIKRSVYNKECSSKLDIQESLIIQEVERIRKLKWREQAEKGKQAAPEEILMNTQEETPVAIEPEKIDPYLECEKTICRLIIEKGKEKINETQSVADYIFHELEGKTFKHVVYRQFFDYCLELYHQGLVMDTDYFLKHELDAVSKPAIDLATPQYDLANWNFKSLDIELPKWGENYIKETEAAVVKFLMLHIHELFQENQHALKTAQEEKNEDMIHERLLMSKALQEYKSNFAQRIGLVL